MLVVLQQHAEIVFGAGASEALALAEDIVDNVWENAVDTKTERQTHLMNDGDVTTCGDEGNLPDR